MIEYYEINTGPTKVLLHVSMIMHHDHIMLKPLERYRYIAAVVVAVVVVY